MSEKVVRALLVLFVILAGVAVGALFFLRLPAPDAAPSETPVSHFELSVGR